MLRVRPRDYVETFDGLACAVVSDTLVPGKYVVTPRYVRQTDNDGIKEVWNRITAAGDSQGLKSRLARITLDFPALGCRVPVVDAAAIRNHYSASHLAMELASSPQATDSHRSKAQRVLGMLAKFGVPSEQIGLTGSVLIGAEQAGSDLDFVLYSSSAFSQVRSMVGTSPDCHRLKDADWRTAYARRGASLDYEDYIWHEARKQNKMLIEGTKVDFGLQSVPSTWSPPSSTRKLRRVCLRAKVLESEHAFDTPARWKIDWPDAGEVVCWTATYVGQAFAGERIEVSGWLEETNRGRQVVVGTSREAGGEFIRVVRD